VNSGDSEHAWKRLVVAITGATGVALGVRECVGDLVDHIAYRTLDPFGITVPRALRWEGLPRREKAALTKSLERAGRAI
jgi:3-polyprenyl-4-hydroxybenzoate decarboxylase